MNFRGNKLNSYLGLALLTLIYISNEWQKMCTYFIKLKGIVYVFAYINGEHKDDPIY